jgi:hypothetical protein
MTTEPDLTAIERRARYAGLGCFSVFAGFISMAMVGALLSMIVTKVTRGPVCQDIPACDWYIYAGVGGLLGALSLPILVLTRVWQSERDAARKNQ